MNWNIKCENVKEFKGGLLEALLKVRGLEENEFDEFLDPFKTPLASPYVFSDMKKAKERIFKAIENKEKILIWGDFDCDGVTSTAILHKTLTKLGADFEYIIPDRDKMGHGLHSKELFTFCSKKHPKVVITVDCGISNIKEAIVLKGLKVDLIITDHHKAPETLPEAYAIINPKAPDSIDSKLSFNEIKNVSELCGAGVAHKLASALLEEVEDDKLKSEILALACVGTIADVVPLLYENRKITAMGLREINNGIHKGIDTLFKMCKKTGEISSYDIAFTLAPRINATGRLKTAEPAFRLLTEEEDGKLCDIVKGLNKLNEIRQNLCETTYSEAIEMINADKRFKKQEGIVLFKENWHIGIIGIGASKIVEEFYKPVFMMTKGEKNTIRCSIRGIKEYNVGQILDELKSQNYFENGGGHSLAGGFSFDSEVHPFETVKKAILASLKSKNVTTKGPMLNIDCALEADDITEDIIKISKMLEPTGQANPAPVFCVKNAVLQSKKVIGKESNHLSFTASKNDKTLSCVRWRQNDIPVLNGEEFDFAFEVKLNTFNGKNELRFDTIDIKSQRTEALETLELETKFYDHRMKEDILASIEEYVNRPNVDVKIYAKKISTKQAFKNYPKLNSLAGEEDLIAKDIMFFDYPANVEDFTEILSRGYSKIHLMKEDFSENIEDYIRQLIGILKYASNNKEGKITVREAFELTGTNEIFIQTVLEILNSMGSIEILNENQIKFNFPPHLETFFQHPLFSELNEEFLKIIDFKKYLASVPQSEIEELI